MQERKGMRIGTHLFILNYSFIFIFDSTGSSLLCMGFLWWWEVGAALQLWQQTSHCSGFSLCRAQVPGHAGFSSCGSWVLECVLSSCGSWASLPCGTWNFPRSGIEPMSPALSGRFPTTGPPGKSCNAFILKMKRIGIVTRGVVGL